MCLPSIVNEFLRQAKAARLFNASVDSAFEDALEFDLSRTFGGINRLDMFFPFDPYLLKESDRFATLTSFKYFLGLFYQQSSSAAYLVCALGGL